MSYQHKWVNDWARYVVYYMNGDVRESSRKPNTNGLAMGKFVYLAKVQQQEEETTIQRYTDQQMELEALNEGWVLWSGGDCPVDSGTFGEAMLRDCSTLALGSVELWTYLPGFSSAREVIAYRLSNADGYKDGVKVEDTEPERTECSTAIQTLTGMGYEWFGGSLWKPPIGPIPDHILNTKPKWIDGLPPVGDRFEALDPKHQRWNKGRVTAHGEKTILVVMEKQSIESLLNKTCCFRPIPDKKQQVIDAAAKAVKNCEYNKELESLYDAGMLTMPDKENNQ